MGRNSDHKRARNKLVEPEGREYRGLLALSSLFLSGIIFFLPFLVGKAHAALGFTKLGSVVDSGSSVSGSNFGIGTAAGDINGDGYQDLVVAASMYPSAGRLYVFFGGASLDTTPDITISGVNLSFPNSQWSNLSVADLDQDGYDDLILGSPSTSNGKGYIFFGSSSLSGSLTVSSADITFNGNTTSLKSLGSATAVGDFNGDGHRDVAFGCFGAYSNAGSAGIFYGNGTKSFDTTVDKILTVSGSSFLTYDTLRAGDVNNDGYDDLVLAELYLYGKAYLFWGGADMDTTYDVKFNQEAGSDYLPRAALDMKDFNNDNYQDFCFGAHQNGSGGTKAGRVYCFLGSPGLSGTKSAASADFIFTGASANDNFGRHLFLYDVNNDGYKDLIVGAYQTSGSANGYVKVYLSNGTSGFDTTADATITAADISESGKLFGNWIGAGDMDNDGWADLFLTSARGGNGTGDTGRVHIFEVNHGSPSISVTTGSYSRSVISGTASNSGVNLSKVQWSTGNNPLGTWNDCSPSDGSFDSASEGFSCDVSSFSDGPQAIYLRSYDANSVYLPSASYVTKNFTMDTVEPETPSLDSGSIGNVSSAPSGLSLKKSTDPRSGISSYSVSLDNGRNRSFSVSSIPSTSGRNQKHHVWQDDNDVKVEFFYEDDSDSSNDEIKITFKDLNNNPLSEGRHHWQVTITDSAGNTRTVSTNLDIDLTQPSVFDLTVADVAASVSPEGVFVLPETNRMPVFMGKVSDLYKGSTRTNSNGTTDTFETVSSGPEKLTLSFYQLQSSGSYSLYSTTSHTFKDIIDKQNPEKYSDFYLQTPYPLTDGYYKVILSLKDKAGNEKDQDPFYLSLNYQGIASAKEKETLIIEKKKIPVETEEEKERIKKEGVTLQVTVLDQQTQPIERAKVTLYSEPRTEFTNQEGIATFNNVPQGEHEVVIAYRNYKSEPQPLNLNEPDIKTYEITVRVEEAKPGFPWLGLAALAGFLTALIFIALIFWLRSKKQP